MDKSERTRFEALVARIPPETASILDVGCTRHNEEKRSRANLHDYIINNTDSEVLGIDILEDEIHRMRENGYDVQVANAEEIDLGRKFDIITAGEVIEHFANPGKFFERASEHLATDGKIVLTTPNPDGFAYFRMALTGETNNPTHTCWVDPFNLESILAATDTDLSLSNWEYLPPTGGVSMLLWKAGQRRAASPGFVATVSPGDGEK